MDATACLISNQFFISTHCECDFFFLFYLFLLFFFVNCRQISAMRKKRKRRMTTTEYEMELTKDEATTKDDDNRARDGQETCRQFSKMRKRNAE